MKVVLCGGAMINVNGAGAFDKYYRDYTFIRREDEKGDL